jgi:hypothetical protein
VFINKPSFCACTFAILWVFWDTCLKKSKHRGYVGLNLVWPRPIKQHELLHVWHCLNIRSPIPYHASSFSLLRRTERTGISHRWLCVYIYMYVYVPCWSHYIVYFTSVPASHNITYNYPLYNNPLITPLIASAACRPVCMPSPQVRGPQAEVHPNEARGGFYNRYNHWFILGI